MGSPVPPAPAGECQAPGASAALWGREEKVGKRFPVRGPSCKSFPVAPGMALVPRRAAGQLQSCPQESGRCAAAPAPPRGWEVPGPATKGPPRGGLRRPAWSRRHRAGAAGKSKACTGQGTSSAKGKTRQGLCETGVFL